MKIELASKIHHDVKATQTDMIEFAGSLIFRATVFYNG